MDAVSTVTQKGQVTIPLFIRESLGMGPKTKVVFTKDKDRVYLRPARNFLELAGTIRSRKPFDIGQMTKTAQKYIAKRHVKGR